MVYETQPISATILTIPPRYVHHERQWASQICARRGWRFCAATGEICDGEGELLADGLDILTASLVTLGWIVPREEGETTAGIVWRLIPAESRAAKAEIVRVMGKANSDPKG